MNQTTTQAEPLTILQELERDRQRLNRATTELYQVTLKLRGGVDENSELVRGLADRFQEVWDQELIRLEERYLELGQRPPAEDIRTARVNKIVREKHRELWLEYIALESREKSLKQTISGRKAAINAAQSILKGEKG